jgi:hypothetical protein
VLAGSTVALLQPRAEKGEMVPVKSWCRAALAVLACSVCGYAWRAQDGGAWWIGALTLLSGVLLVLSGMFARGAGDRPARPRRGAAQAGGEDTRFNPRLGELLVDRYGLLTRAQLERALTAQRGTTRRLGQVLLEMGLIRPDDLMQALEDQRLWRDIWQGLDNSLDDSAGAGRHVVSLDEA